MKVLWNDEDEQLWCCNCKQRINLGEKFLRTKETYGGESYNKDFHPECVFETEEDEDYINE